MYLVNMELKLGYYPALASLDPPVWLLSQGHPGQSFILGMVMSVESLQRSLHSAPPQHPAEFPWKFRDCNSVQTTFCGFDAKEHWD